MLEFLNLLASYVYQFGLSGLCKDEKVTLGGKFH
jgi:hypothetical protein